jgi:hypothetical protein
MTRSDHSSTRTEDPFAYQAGLDLPVIGMESEFVVFLDGVETEPEKIWKHPSDFISVPVLKRATRASQLPTGGALYFDKGVLELVTPIIEIEPGATSRMVRSIWEGIGFVRDHLDEWGAKHGHDVRLAAFSTHYNVSFELERQERGSERTIQKLAVLLAHILPPLVIVIAANRRSTGVGVRPRRDRLEVTVDFTPDPGLMLATAALIVGVVREVIRWPSYRLAELDRYAIPILTGLEPGRHTTRKGWLARAANFERNPFLTSLDAPVWKTSDGRSRSLRQLALETAEFFRSSIRDVSDAFSERVLFGVLEKRLPALLDLDGRPAAYDDIGRLIRWGSSLPELENFSALKTEADGQGRRRVDVVDDLEAPWTRGDTERRSDERSAAIDRRKNAGPERPPLPRSRYESIFLDLVSGKPLEVSGDVLEPVRMKGWYHAVFRNRRTGEEQVVGIEQLVKNQKAEIRNQKQGGAGRR